MRTPAPGRGDSAIETLTAALHALPQALMIVGPGDDPQDGELQPVVLFVNEAAASACAQRPAQLVGGRFADLCPAPAAGRLGELLAFVLDTNLPTSDRLPGQGFLGFGDELDVAFAPLGLGQVLITWTPAGTAGDGPAMTGPGTMRPGPDVLDPLTGLPTREEFKRLVRAEFLVDFPVDRPWYLVVLDIDRFGLFNDLQGGRRADNAILKLARALRRLDPEVRALARVGADSFALLLPGGADGFDVDGLAARLRDLVQQIGLAEEPMPITLSGGVRQLVAGHPVDAQLRDCDTALRVAARRGGDDLQMFDLALRQELLSDEVLADEIRGGVYAGEFLLEYQPIVHLRDRSRFAHEALVRWRHPVRGRLYPGAFIQVAETSRAILPLGQWILDTALAATLSHGPVSINLSVVQLMDHSIVDDVAAALDRQGVDPSLVILEMTESIMYEESTRLRHHLDELKAVGTRLAIDDFGSGYSSIRYLHSLPVDIVKLDMGLIRGQMTPSRERLLRASVEMVKAIGALPVIEGVETQEQLDLVAGIGIELAQGYLLGRPGPLPAA